MEKVDTIFRVFTHRCFRAGALPAENVSRQIKDKIAVAVEKSIPIPLFLFWGGAKNPNLDVDYAELCEAATLQNLKRLNENIAHIYEPGLHCTMFPGDKRIELVNKVPLEKTKRYVDSLAQIASSTGRMFTVVPVSTLYAAFHEEFQKELAKVRLRFDDKLFEHTYFKLLAANAAKNHFTRLEDSRTQLPLIYREAAKDYVLYRVAGEDAKIFRDYADAIRISFVRYSPFAFFYRMLIEDYEHTLPRIDCLLHLYTGSKGNITQPWQAVGKKHGDKILFISQNRVIEDLSERL